MYEEIMIHDRSTGGHETPLSEVLANLGDAHSPTAYGLDPDADVAWDFIINWDDENDPGHWEWTALRKREITPHKGGRTERLYARVRPETKRAIEALLKEQDISLADWIEQQVAK